jgi:hypothetical protein
MRYQIHSFYETRIVMNQKYMYNRLTLYSKLAEWNVGCSVLTVYAGGKLIQVFGHAISDGHSITFAFPITV